MNHLRPHVVRYLACGVSLLAAASVYATGPSFIDIVTDGTSGIHYSRQPSERLVAFEALSSAPSVTVPFDLIPMPNKPRGLPGIALFDYDGDRDLDIYVTNGPGAANSLFANQLAESGQLTFIDRAGDAGVEALGQDSSGVVAGDIDNDGDRDLYVLGIAGNNLLFENQGDGTFLDITAASGTGGGPLTSSSATFGDVNQDGLLDIFVANSTDFDNNVAIFDPYTPLNEHNQLFLNLGGNQFADVSAASGVQFHAALPPGFQTLPTYTHACAFVDIDGDGDIDLVTADDQGATPPSILGGLDNGLLHVFRNQGGALVSDASAPVGSWMGLAFGDFDGNGRMDMFGTNVGSYNQQLFPMPFPPGTLDSRWFLGQEDGTFTDSGAGSLALATPFGWGTVSFDVENDGDTDLLYHGGLDFGVFINSDNPGVLLINDGHADFTPHTGAFATDHSRRIVHGVAAGDLDRDGRVDIVSASNFDFAPQTPTALFPPLGATYDAQANFAPRYVPTGNPQVFARNPFFPPMPDGSLSVEINRTQGGGWIAVDLLGTHGLSSAGATNRDGVGATVTVRSGGRHLGTVPIIAGDSYASSNSLTAHFGLGTARRARIDVLWPSGVRNRLYLVRDGSRVVFPEIPVSFDDPDISLRQYLRQVRRHLDELVANGTINRFQRARFFLSALRAFLEERH